MVTKLLRSMVAAGVAGFVLKKVDAALKAKQYSHKDQDQAEHEHFETKRRGVDKLVYNLPVNVTDTQREVLARVAQYGVTYLVSSVTRKLRNELTRGRGSVLGGALFGVVTFVIVEKLLEPALGISPSPFSESLETHMRGLIAHAIYGVTDTTTRALLGA